MSENMENNITLPHRRAHGLCPVNGIRDLVEWRTGKDYSNEFLFGLGQGGGFAYLRFNFANPPRQVYWGTSSARQHKYLAELFNSPYTELENRSFKYSWNKAQEAVRAGTPPVVGPLDMFYLHFYGSIYQQRHIPIHYLLLVGYDDQNAYVHDTDKQEVQSVPLAELEPAWDVNVPGLGKRNRLAILNIPQEIPPTEVLIRKSIGDECRMMLNPPVSMVGIPAMEKVSREIAHWSTELGKDGTEKSLQQVREYLNSPPDILGNHLTAGRDIYVTFLEQAGRMTNLDFSEAINRFQAGIAVMGKIAEAIQLDHLDGVAAGFAEIAKEEKAAFTILLNSVGGPG
jgi:hypothetical protein